MIINGMTKYKYTKWMIILVKTRQNNPRLYHVTSSGIADFLITSSKNAYQKHVLDINKFP